MCGLASVEGNAFKKRGHINERGNYVLIKLYVVVCVAFMFIYVWHLCGLCESGYVHRHLVVCAHKAFRHG
jgi:hypothetical protein